MAILFMSTSILKFADENRIKQDIDEVNTTDRDILSKISRSNEDASMEMAAIFLNNFNIRNPPDWLVQITTEYATALFWIKSTGTAESITQANNVLAKADRILINRFQPVRSRMT